MCKLEKMNCHKEEFTYGTSTEEKYIKFNSAQEMLVYLHGDRDLYNPETGEYVWRYNEAGSIAVDRLNNVDILRILDEIEVFRILQDKEGYESWSGYIPGGSDIWDDTSYDGCKVTKGCTNFDYCKGHYAENWVDCKEYGLWLLKKQEVNKRMSEGTLGYSCDTELVQTDDEAVKIEGILFVHGEDDFGLCEGFCLSEEDENAIQQILSKYDTEGWSVRGTRKQIAEEMAAELFADKFFTDEELLLLSKGMLALIRDVGEAANLVPDDHEYRVLQDLAKKYQALNSKVCEMVSDSEL